MELTKRIKSRLSEASDWNAALDQLESEARSAGDKAAQSAAFFELGRVDEGTLLDKARAMQCYQAAFKLNQRNLLALQHARQIYQEMAHLEMVKKLMKLELKLNRDKARAAGLNYNYGWALLNSGALDQARQFLELAASLDTANAKYNERFQETLYDRSNWEFALQNVVTQLTALTGQQDPLAADVTNGGDLLSGLFLRAARILQCEAPEDQRLLPMLFKALDADPLNAEAGFVAETLLAGGGHLQHVQKLQDRRASLVEDVSAKVALLRKFAVIWQVRLNNAEMAAYFYRQALEFAFTAGGAAVIDDGHHWVVGAYRALKLQADQAGQAEGLADLGARGIPHVTDADDCGLIALNAGEVAWKLESNVALAQSLFGYVGSMRNAVLDEFVATHGAVAAVDPAAEQAAAEQARLAAEQAAAEQAAAERAAADNAAAEREAAQRAAEQEAAERAAAEQAAAEQAAAERAAAEQSAAEQSAEQSAAEQAAAEQAAAEQAAAEKAAAEKAAAEKAAAEKAAAEKAAAEKAAAKKAAAEKAAAEKAAKKAEKAAKKAAKKAAAEKAAAEAVSAEPGVPSEEFGGETFTAEEIQILGGAKAAEGKGTSRAIDAWRDAVHRMPNKRYPRVRLTELYVAANKWSNVADLHKDELKHLGDHETDRKIEVYWELIALYRDRLRQPGLVVTTLASLEKLLDNEGETEALLKVVETQQAQFEKMKRWPDLIGRIRRRAELTEDPTAQVELYLEAGRLFLEKFNNQAEAIKSFEAVLAADEYNLEAITKLKELYGRRRDWEKMVALKQKELDLIDDPADQLAQLIDIAKTAVAKIKKNPLSIELWNQVIEIEPDNIEALTQLQNLYEREKDWSGLSKILQTLVEIETDDRKRAQLLVKLGPIYSDKIGDNKAAIRNWETLVEFEPNNRRAQDQLKKLYLAEGEMDSLEDFYAKQDKWSEFVRVLEREVESAPADKQINLLLKVAELYKVRMDKPDRSIRALEKGLGVDDNNLTVAEALIELYEEAGDERHISRPLVIKLNHSEDPAERQELLRRLADLAERIDSNTSQAFDYYRTAFSEDHTPADARDHLIRLAEGGGYWVELVEAFEAAIEKFGAAEESIPLRLKVAHVYEQQLNELEKALAVNQAVLDDIDAEQETALASLERLFLALGRESDLLGVLGAQLSLADNVEDQRAIQTRIGNIHEQLGNHDDAIEAYEAVLATGVEDPTVLGALDRMFLGLEKYTELADIIRRELEVTDAEDVAARSGLLLRLGILHQEKLSDPTGSIDLFRQVLENDVANEEARTRLEGWLEDEEQRTPVAGILLPVYEQLEFWPQVVQCLEIQVASEEDRTHRVELLLRIGSILIQALGDTGKAFEAYSRAFKDDPENEVAQAELEKIASVEDRYADFASLFEEAVAADEDLSSELLRDLLMKLAGLYDRFLNKSDRAIECYRRAVEVDVENMPALDALEVLYSRDENWAPLLDVYRNKIALTDDPEGRQTLRFQIAYIQDQMLTQVEEAIATYNEILSDDYENQKAIVALDRLYQVSEQWVELAENLERQLTLATDAESLITLNLRLGEIQLSKLEQAGMAVQTYSRVLEIDAGNDTATAALETLLDNEAEQLGVAKILEPAYRANNQWPRLIQAYEIMVTHSEDPVEKLGLLGEIARLHEITGDEKKAFEALGRGLRVDPAHEETQARLDNLARQMGAYAELVALYEEVIPDIVNDELVIAILFKVAQIQEQVLQDPEKAAASYERVMDIDPTNFDSVDYLIELHRRNNNYEALVAAVVRKSEMVDNVDDRKSLVLYAADVREKIMEDPEGAIDLYQQVLAIDDTDATALDALQALYIQTENWDSLKDVYRRKAELADDLEIRRQTLHALGAVFDQKLESVDRAIETYQSILDLEPFDYAAIQCLDRLFGQAERWPDQLQILERAVEVTDNQLEQAEYRYRIGALWEKELADPVRAVESYSEVLRFAHDHAATIEALDRIVHGDTEPMLAAEVLAPLYEQLTEWEKLVDIYDVMAKHTEDPPEKIERLHMVAAIYERQLSLFDRAFEALARALAVDSTHEVTIAELNRLADLTGEYERLAKLLAERAEDVLDPMVKIDMLLRQARVQEEKLNNVDNAIARYLEVLDSDPEHREAIASLDRVFTSLERWPELVENLRRQMLTAEDEEQSIDTQFRMGQIYQMSMGDLPHAIEAYREILNINPDHSPTLTALELIFEEGEHQAEIAEILEPLYYAAERWTSLVKLSEVKLESTEHPQDKLDIIRNVGELCERRLGDAGQAFYWWLRAYMVDPTSEDVTEQLERLADITQEWGYIVEVSDQILENEDLEPEVRRQVLSRAGRVLDEHIQDPARAIDAYCKVLEINPENNAALEALDRIYSQTSMWEELVDILRRRIQATMDTELLIDLEMRLAGTYEQYLGDPEEAIAAYNRAIEVEPGNLRALEALEALFLTHYRWDELFNTYQKMVDVANTDEDMAGCYQRMAKLASETLDRELDSVDLWNRVLDLRGEDPLALNELATLHEREARWDDLAEVLERLVYAIEDRDHKVAVFQRLGKVYGDKLDKPRNALDSWLNALEINDRDLETLTALHRIYEESESWMELVDTLMRLISLGEAQLGREQLRDYYAQVGKLQGEYLMQTDLAIDAWLQVVELEPSHMEALAALEALYSGEARWQEVIQVLERKARVVEDHVDKVAVLMQIAALWEERLENHMEAVGAYLEVLELDRSFMEADAAVEAIYRETHDWGSLVPHLIDRAESTEDSALQVASLQAAAKVIEENLNDVDFAFQVLQNAFKLDYSNEATSLELERIATQANKWGLLLSEYNGIVTQIADPKEQCELWVKIGRWYGEHLNRPDYGVQSLQKALQLNDESVNALRELSNFYRRDGNAEELAATLARIVPLEQDPDVKIATLLDLAEVQDSGLSLTAESITSYYAVLEIDEDNLQALDNLLRLHEQEGQWNELVAILGRRAPLMEDIDQALVLRKRIGHIQDTALESPTAAIETYRDILTSEPTDHDALTALERLYLAQNSIPEYLDVLGAQLDATLDSAEQVAIYDKQAKAHVELASDSERATEVLEKILEIDSQREVTYQQLEELYAQLEKWSELVDTQRRHVEAISDISSKITILLAMGEVYEEKIEDLDRSIDTYKEVLQLDGRHYQAAETLSKLQERVEDWPEVIQTLDLLVELSANDPEQRIEHLTRSGQVLLEKLLDQDQSEMRLIQALDIEPGHVPALITLAELYKQRQDWLKAARNLESAAEFSKSTLETTNLAAEAGFIYYEELDDEDKSVALFAKVLELDPEHIRAGRILADIYYQRKEHSSADPIFDVLTRKVENLELDDYAQRELFLRAARVARALDNSEKALKQYQRAYEIDSTDHDVLVGMADLLFSNEDWDRAFKLYQTILVQHRDSQSPEETVLVYFRLGTIKRKQNESRKALNYLEKALEVDPHDRKTLGAVIELQQGNNDWEGVIQAKRALVDIAADGVAQADLYKEIGKLYLDKVSDWKKSAAAYQSALDLQPTDYPLLHTLLDIYTRNRGWDDAVRIIDRIVEIEKEPKRRSRYNYTAAVLLRDEIKAHDEAIDRFNTVLNDDPTFLKAFQAIDTMVTKSKDWKTLERSYRKMLKRLPSDGETPLKITLWKNLAEIYRTRLRNYKAAAAAFEVAAKLDPENVDIHFMIAELYETLLQDHPTEYVPHAVREHQILIGREPFRYASYHALFNIYMRSKQIDKAYCVARTLAFLKQATEPEQALYEKYVTSDFRQARQRLSEETLRRHVFTKDEDPFLTGILGSVAPAVAAWKLKSLPPAYRDEDRIDISIDKQPISQMANYVCNVLNVGRPDVYLRPNDPGDVQMINASREGQIRPTMIVYANLLKGKHERHLAFALGRHMLDLYLPHYAYVALDRSPQTLKAVFMVCMHMCGLQVGQVDRSAVRNISERLPANYVDQMKSLMRRFVESGGSTDVKLWAQATELAGYRVGLLLCDDMQVAAHIISQEQTAFGSTMTPKDKIRELVLYSISEDYFRARRNIGMHVA